MRADGPAQGDDVEPSVVVPVAAVIAGKAVPTLPRVVIVALLVAVVAFLGGVELGAGRTSPPAPPATSPASASAPPGVVALPVTPGSDASDFAGTFRPTDIVARLDRGAVCASHTVSNSDPGPRSGQSPTLVRVWAIFCPLAADERESLLDQVTNTIGQQTPGISWSTSSNVVGSTVALFPYTQGPFAGTVTLAADAAGAGFEIVITLQERLAE